MKRGLFGAYPPKGVVKRIPVFQVMTHMIPGVYCLIFNKLHSNWVNSARYFQLAKGLECFISCCSTDEDSMFLGDLTHVTYKPKWPGFSRLRSNRSCYYKVKKGVLALDYSKEWNLIVTGSFDCIVRTWNPYSSKPASVIKGHLTPVQHITVIPGSGQVITCGKDKTVRVIDLRDHTTIQIIRPRLFASMGPLSHAFNTIFYDKRCKCMLLGTTQVGVLRGFDGKKKIDLLDVKSHTGAVVTAGHDSVLSVWDLNTGSKTIQFHTIKGVELTCMCFDQTDRRLITGSRNGAVKIWNFNNGACLRTLSPGNGLEVTGVVCLKQKIITAGWNKKLTVYIDSQDQDTEDDVKEWAEVHHDDILCLASFRHNNGVATIASSSYDGNVFIWSLDSGHVLCRLNKMISYSPLSYKGSKAAKRDKPDYSKLKRTHTLTRLEKSLSMVNNKLKLPQISSKLGVEKSTEFSDKVSTLKLPPIFPKQGYGDQNKDRWKEPIATSSRASIRLSSPKANSVSTIMPSAGGEDTCNFDKTNHAQHQLDVLLGKQNRDYWEAEVAIDKLLFLQSRPHSPHTATLVSSGAQGWVHSWSVHPQGGLLGQFMAAQNDGESVVSMATDDENSILISGDSTGYVKVWDIDTYCYKKPRQHPKRKSLVNDIFNTQLHSALMDEEAANLLSARRMVRLNTVPPDLNHYFRAHVGSVNDITYVNEKQLFLTAGSEGTVRLWTVSGSYVGTFGQQFSWSLSNPSTVRIPTDIKRVASSNTFKAFKTGESPWRLAKNLKHFVALRDLGRGKMKSLGPSVVEAKKDELEKVNKTYLKNMKHEDNVERDYEKTVKAMEKSEVLGNWYKPKQRHRMLPKIDIKTHFGNFLIHSSIPFSSLEKMEEIEVPEILKNKWRLQKEMSQLENEAAKARNLRSSIAGVRVKNRILGSFNAKKKSQNRASFSQVAKTVRERLPRTASIIIIFHCSLERINCAVKFLILKMFCQVANRFNQSQPEQQK
ncbi:unnamed protein product [Clavelina lepadiformis]|uniref:WD repeat-containing protein on Y chromosome n=1 Tax=Clavelina lepadiformis TaxID=159417 RepID=A0ABP0GKL1_CLALP